MATPNYRPEETSEIDGFKVITTHMEPLKLYPLAPRIVKIVAPMLGQVGQLISSRAKRAKGEDPGKAIQRAISELMVDPKALDQFAPIIMHLGSCLAEPDNAKLPLELLADTTIDIPDEDGEPERHTLATAKDLNEAFRGRFLLMLKCMWFSMGVNFADFFAGGSPSGRIKSSE